VAEIGDFSTSIEVVGVAAAPKTETIRGGDDLRLGRRVWCLRGKEQEENGIG
jgi:hypothetical protein